MRISSHNLPDSTAQNRPVITVFCAVWHKQPNKLELLRSHWENLKQQSIPIEPCYIFDNDDTAPDWLDCPWHTFSGPLTIYEAWAAAVALARTRYVMNLNMDDRLATDAAELLLNAIQSQGAALVGGEWSVRFDHHFHTEQFSSYDARATNFRPDWPPVQTENLRLGSGTGERGTFGPATLWDLEKTKPWYPTYFGNREPILSIGDSIFWQYLKQMGHKLGRIETVIGRYYSSPNAQAEFRPHNDNENLRQHKLSNISFSQMVSNRKHAGTQSAAAQPKGVQPQIGMPPRSRVEAQSQQLGMRYLKLFGRTVPSQPTV